MNSAVHSGARLPAATLAVLAWTLLVASTLIVRPLLPVDETRYLAVAWEMHRTHDWLVPHLNGQAYAHKPPLMFWLINAGWLVFGVTEWWARLVAPLAALAAALVTGALARRLFPQLDGRAIFTAAATILAGTAIFALYGVLAFFDTLMALFAVLAIYGLVLACDGTRLGFIVFGAAIGLGVLTKGPVVLVYALPPALLAPWWIKPGRVRSWLHWYAGVGGGVALGAAIALAWAIPAAIAGGEAYADELLWKQSSGRMVASFAHRQPAWWYLALLLPVTFPWAAWPPLWRAVARVRWTADEGVRLCLIWFGAALLILSLISGKQPHYLLPILPAFAAFLAAQTVSRPPSRRDQLWPALLLGAVGLAFVAVALIAPLREAVASRLATPTDLAAAGLIAGPAWIAIAVAAAMARPAVAAVAALPCLALIALQLAVGPHLRAKFDVAPIARFIGDLQRSGRPVAIIGEYHGEFQFAGRLAPLAAIAPTDGPAWTEAHPQGFVIVSLRRLPAAPIPVLAQPLRGRMLTVWTAAVAGRHWDVVTAR